MTLAKLLTTSFNVLVSITVIMNFISFFERTYNTLNPNFLSEFLCFIPLLLLAMTISIKRLTENCSYGYILLILIYALDPTWPLTDVYVHAALGVVLAAIYAVYNERALWMIRLKKLWA
jgi:hypothetical protein